MACVLSGAEMPARLAFASGDGVVSGVKRRDG